MHSSLASLIETTLHETCVVRKQRQLIRNIATVNSRQLLKLQTEQKMLTKADPFTAVLKTLTMQAIASVSDGSMIRKK